MRSAPELNVQSRYAPQTPLWLSRFTKLVAGSTLFLIFAGAMVTSTGSGLAVPDWPLSYGRLMPKMVAGIFYEHGHRMIAATVGFLTIIQAVWLQRREPKRFVRLLGWISLAAVIVQGILGGLTVKFLLPPAISIAHAGLAEIFLLLNVSIAFFTSLWYRSLQGMERGDTPVGTSTALVVLVYVQILVGALMRHRGAGLAIPDFPRSFGRWIPEFSSVDILVNYLHRVGGILVAIAVIAIAVRLLRFAAGHPLRQVATVLVVIVAAQILLGGYTVWSGTAAPQAHHALPATPWALSHQAITSLHVANGALTLALSFILALVSRTLAWPRVRDESSRRTLVQEVLA